MLVKLFSGAILRNALKQRFVDMEIEAKNPVLAFFSLLDSTPNNFNRNRRTVKDTLRIVMKTKVDSQEVLSNSEKRRVIKSIQNQILLILLTSYI